MPSRPSSKFAWLLLPWVLVASGQTDPLKSGQNRVPATSGNKTEVPAASTAEAEARGVIETLNQALLEAMKRAGELGYQGRYRLLEPVVRQTFDFRAISRYVLGSHWKRLSPEQQERFVEKMARYGVATYAAQFDDYGGERFIILSDKPFRGRFRVVKAKLQSPKDEDVEFVYILRRTRDGWKIVDVRYDGISDLALKRGQFGEILEKEGFEALLSKLDRKIADYATGDKKQTKTG